MPTFESNQNLYAFTRALADHARSLGDAAVAAHLEDALHTGSTSSEVLGELRAAFKAVKPRIDDRYPHDTRARLDSAMQAIDHLFRRGT